MPAERRRMLDLVRSAAVPELQWLPLWLGVAELYWVTRDMARAALDASVDIPGWSVEALPCAMGMVWRR